MPVRLSREDIRAYNQAFIEALDDPALQKRAFSGVTDYVRTIVREGESILDDVMQLQQVDPAEFDRRVDSDAPYIVIDKEPDAPAAFEIPFRTWPDIDFYLEPDRFPITFTRIASPRAMKDKIELMTYHMDLRQVISDIMRKEINRTRSQLFLAAVDAAMIGLNQPVPYNDGVVQWRAYSGGISRNTMAEILKIANEGPSRLEFTMYLMNQSTHKEFLKWERPEVGGDLAEEILVNGKTRDKLNGRDVRVTIYRDLVPDGTVYLFGDEEYLGKNLVLEDITMFAKVEDHMLNWYFAGVYGAAIGHTGGLGRADIAI